jgi:type II secretory pathway component PulC
MAMTILTLALCLVALPVVDTVAGEPVMTDQAPVNAGSEETSSGESVAASLQKNLDLVLLGTVLHDSGEPMAIIQIGQSGEQNLYRLGDVVEGGRITKILRDSITLTFEEIEVELGLTGGGHGASAAMATVTDRVQPPLTQTEGVFWRVERETLDDLSHAPELVMNVKSMGSEGVRIDKVNAEGIFHKLGLQQGDIIRNINGRVPGTDLSLQQAVAQSEMGKTMLRLEIERQGSMDVVYYKFDPLSGTVR